MNIFQNHKISRFERGDVSRYLVLEIAEIDMQLEETQEKNRHLKQDGGSPYQFEE